MVQSLALVLARLGVTRPPAFPVRFFNQLSYASEGFSFGNALLENRQVYFCRLGSIELPQKQESSFDLPIRRTRSWR